MTDSKSDKPAQPWISTTGYTPQLTGENVLTAARKRINRLLDMNLRYVVSFSAGKDSTTVLMLSLEQAKLRDRLPLDVVFLDEELLDPDTIKYAEEVRKRSDVNFHWFCVPIRHTLRARGRSCWWTWDPDERAVWARDLPAGAITEVAGTTKDASYRDIIKAYFAGERFVCATGIRAQESFNRRRSIVVGGDYVVEDGNCVYAKPIYDWSADDIWRAMIRFKWSYSACYEKQRTAGLPLTRQRIGPWGNVAQAQVMDLWAQFYPDFWQKATVRLPELRPAAMYGKSKLYREILNKPVGLTWQDYTMQLVDSLDADSQTYWRNWLTNMLARWGRQASVPFPEESLTSKLSWKHICFRIGKNDRYKGESRDN
jgi:predicted phosphoadenosine phosphosulfate sulfurtransferase